MPEMDGIQMTRRIRQLYAENQQDKPSLGLGDMNNKNFINMLNSVLSSDIHSALKNNNHCIIWAITAMNETEIEDMVGEGCLNGISTKPMSKDALGGILSKFGLINHSH